MRRGCDVARIRSIKPEFWSDEQVMECSPLARLLFIGIWNFCDDGGNHPLSEKTLKALIFPGDSIDTAEIRRLLVELSSNDLLRFYESSGKLYLNVPGWRHQKIDRPTYKHPDFDDGVPLDCQKIWPADHVVDDTSSNARRMLDEASPPERKGEDVEKIKSTVEQAEIFEQQDQGKKPEKPVDPIPYGDFLSTYQRVTAGVFLGAEKLTDARKRAIRKAWNFTARGKKPFQDQAFFDRYLQACLKNAHWCGDNDRKWRADLEFVLRESNIVKVLGV